MRAIRAVHPGGHPADPDRGDAADELALGEEVEEDGGIIMIRLAAIRRFIGAEPADRVASATATVNFSG